MKVLLREYEGKHYVWKDAQYSADGYYVLTDNADEIWEFQILAVTEDERSGYVRCKYCKELVKNDPESIEKHYTDMEAKKDCLSCEYLRNYGSASKISKTYTKNEDGTYDIHDVYRTILGCRRNYTTYELDSEEANRRCKFNECRRQGMESIDDAFLKYPGLFEKQITVDMLKAKGFKYEQRINGYYEYDLKMRGTVKANVNELGIVEHFTFYKSGWAYRFYYSDKYKKLFFLSWNKYCEYTRDWVTQTKEEQIITKLSKLYEEATENE